MAAPIDFYFDFSSPYGYIAAERIDGLAARHGREVAWRPILLGVVFKTTGQTPLPGIPIKGEYAKRDFARSARMHGIAFREPAQFPISTVTPVRAFYWQDARDPAKARQLALALYRAYFRDGIDISSPDATVAAGASCGLNADELRAGINDPAVKDRTRAAVEQAMAKGVFGSPYIVVDGEPFWGADRLEQAERWMATGGW
jgi:2-hydroxychromene-2-carboxylate isomerase